MWKGKSVEGGVGEDSVGREFLGGLVGKLHR